MGRVEAIQVAIQRRMLQLEGQTVRMGIGEQIKTPTTGANRLEEGAHIRSPADLVGNLPLERQNVEAKLLAPVIQTVPIQGSRHGGKHRLQLLAGRLHRQATAGSPAFGHQPLPEVVVEVQIDQGAVHI